MTNERQKAALRVQADLLAYERALDRALAMGGRLTAALPAARVKANFAAEVGQDALDELMLSLSSVANARRHAVHSHRSLNKARIRFRLPIVAAGDKLLSPPPAEDMSIVGGNSNTRRAQVLLVAAESRAA